MTRNRTEKKNTPVVKKALFVTLLLLLVPWSVSPAGEMSLQEKEGLDLADTTSVKTYYRQIPDSQEQQVVALAVIDAPIEVVWDSVADLNRLGKGSSMLEVTKVEKKSSQLTQVDLTLRLPWPLKNMTCILEFSDDTKTHEMKWKNIGGCVKNNRGRITLQKEGEKTVMQFCVALELGNSLPQWLVNWALKKKLPAEIGLIRKSVESRQKMLEAKLPG
jgi:uncharacterized membrane protein